MDGLVLDRVIYYLIDPESIFWTDHDTAEVAHTLGLVAKTSWTTDLSQMIWKRLHKKYANTPQLPERELFWYYTRSRLEHLGQTFGVTLHSRNSIQTCLSILEKQCPPFSIPLEMRPKIVGQTKVYQVRAIQDFKLSQADLERFDPDVVKNPHYRSRYAYLYNTRDLRKFARHKQYCNQVANRLKHKQIEIVLGHDRISGKITAYRDFTYHVLISRKKQLGKLGEIAEVQSREWVPTIFQIEQESFTGEYRLHSVSSNEHVVFDVRLTHEK
jgi:hypothetical protein